MMNKQFGIGAIFIAFGIAACAPNAEDASVVGDGWELVEGTDKFTNQASRAAQKTFVQDDAQITLEISCNDRGVGYKMTAFDSREVGLDFSTKSGIGSLGNAYNQTRVRTRFDEQEALPLSASVNEYSNQAIVHLRWEKLEASQAKIVLMRLMFVDRSVELEVDQTNPAVQNVLRPCTEVYLQQS